MPRHETSTTASITETWGIRPGLRVWVGGHNVAARQEIETHAAGTERPATGPIDLGLLSPETPDEALYFAGKLRGRLSPGAMVWIVYPNPRAAGGEAFAGGIEEIIVGMFERGFGEIGRGPVPQQFAMIGFRYEGAGETL